MDLADLPEEFRCEGDGSLAWLGALICLGSAALMIWAIVRILS